MEPMARVLRIECQAGDEDDDVALKANAVRETRVMKWQQWTCLAAQERNRRLWGILRWMFTERQGTCGTFTGGWRSKGFSSAA